MITRFRVLLLALFAGVSAQPVVAATTVFVNVNVVPMDEERVLPAQTVVVVDGRIRAIGPVDAVPVPKQAAIVDGTDRFLMPGLAEMHAHVTAKQRFRAPRNAVRRQWSNDDSRHARAAIAPRVAPPVAGR